MTKPVKNTSSRHETEIVEVQGSTKAENSSHQARKRSDKAKVVVGSSDQPQKGGRMGKVVKPCSSDQTKKSGPKAKLPPDEKRRRKRVCDNRRYHRTQNTLREIEEMKPQLKVLEDRVEDMLKQIGNAEFVTHKEKVKSEFAAISQNLETVKADLKGVQNDYKKMESLSDKFFQKELTEDDWMNMETTTGDLLRGEKNLMPDSEYPQDFFDLVGMSKQEIMAEFDKIKDSFEESKRENERRYEELKRENEELKRENEELKRENKKLNSRVTAIETDKSKDAKK